MDPNALEEVLNAFRNSLSEDQTRIAALEYLMAATLARTFATQAELRAWINAANATVIESWEKRSGQETADLYREAFDQVFALALSLHGPSNKKYGNPRTR